VISVLVDRNLEGQALLLWGVLAAEGWLALIPLHLQTLAEVGLSATSSDVVIWRFAQAHGMILLTDNRNRKGKDSLEQTLREEGTPASLPVITIGSSDRVIQRDYRERCARRLLELVLNIDRHLGAGRLFIP
jgi:hypothetical protein